MRDARLLLRRRAVYRQAGGVVLFFSVGLLLCGAVHRRDLSPTECFTSAQYVSLHNLWSLRCHLSKSCLFPLSVRQVIPSLQGDASTQAPPDLPSFIFKERIVYLVRINILLDIVLVLDIVRSTNHSQGMTLVPSVTELILAELLYLQYEDKTKPIYLYINSTGTSKVTIADFRDLIQKLMDSEWSTRRICRRGRNMDMILKHLPYMIPSNMSTLQSTRWQSAQLGVRLRCCSRQGKRWVAHIFLVIKFIRSDGPAQGNRAALPSASIMIKQPIDAFRGQVRLLLGLGNGSSRLTAAIYIFTGNRPWNSTKRNAQYQEADGMLYKVSHYKTWRLFSAIARTSIQGNQQTHRGAWKGYKSSEVF